MRIIGVDYGKKRTGIAISDEEGKFALPYAVWNSDDTLIERIKQLCFEKKADGIVVGESRDLDGSANDILRDILLFKAALESEIALRVYLEPEFYTSAEAERVQGKTKMHDASAAALILKSYLARQANGNH